MDPLDLVSAEDVSSAVLLLGDTDIDRVHADRKRSEAINVAGVKRIVDRLVRAGIRIVYTSTDLVFDGKRGSYTEFDQPNPKVLYGRQKWAVEQYIRGCAPDYTILRLAKVVGADPGDGTLFSAWLNDIEAGRPLRVATDQRFSPVFIDDVAAAVQAAAGGELNGTCHVAGPVGDSRLGLVECLIAAVSERQPVNADVQPCSIRDFGFADERPLDTTLESRIWVNETGIERMTPKDICRRLVTAHAGRDI